MVSLCLRIAKRRRGEYSPLYIALFWQCHENGLIKTIQTIPHLYMSVKLTSLYYGLRLILVYPNPEKREADLKLTHRLWGIV